jgi:hypothetical protein
MSTFNGKQHVGEKFVVMSLQATWMRWRQSGCLVAEVGKTKWCIKLKLVIKTLVFLSIYKNIGNIILTLSHIFTHYSFI